MIDDSFYAILDKKLPGWRSMSGIVVSRWCSIGNRLRQRSVSMEHVATFNDRPFLRVIDERVVLDETPRVMVEIANGEFQ